MESSSSSDNQGNSSSDMKASANNSHNNSHSHHDPHHCNDQRKNMCTRVMCILTLSILMVVYGVTQIAVATGKDEINVRHSWAFIVNGVFCILTGLVGITHSLVPRHQGHGSKGYAMLSFITLVESFVLFVIYSARLRHYIKQDCGELNYEGGFSSYCHDIELYLSVALAIFWCFNVFLLPLNFFVSLINYKSSKCHNSNNNNNNHSNQANNNSNMS
ncbi:hypothetical protein DLAC_03696 [Tieghemostelium lacteum]|uniref:MARVEL domain-containing protein n=1 Tax=Tieghemostelium lacteum TaxID=361077 RepID=A0A152A0M4_TIELA|nr:hypothetical protein DLAC_03696 [Tieghemostelium lacteum]|eukprot:KYQ99753.1 hypothetical protein DLAC_03696 [Tieghemostelium lacteum]